MATSNDWMTRLVTVLQAKVALIPGIKYAPVTISDSVTQFPFSFVIPEDGDVTLKTGEGTWKDVCTISLDIHISRTIIQAAFVQSLPFRDAVINMLLDDPYIGNTVKGIVGLRWHFGVLEYAGTIGWRFSITVKQETP